MAKINYAKLYILRKDGRYQGYWKDADGKRHAVCDRDPEKLYYKIQEKEAPAAALSFEEMLTAWQDKHWLTIREGTKVSYAPAVKRALERFKGRDAVDIQPTEIFAHLEHLRDRDYSAKVIKTQRLIYNLSYQNAIIDSVMGKEVKYNPAASVPLPKNMKRPVEREAPEDDVVKAVRKAAGTAYFGVFPLFLMSTGFRRGEALAVRWRDIDFKNDTISSKTQISFSAYAKETEPKTRAGVRTVPLLPDIKAALLNYKPKDAKPDHFIFPATDPNKFMVESTYKRHWNHYCREMGFVTDEPEQRISKQGKKYTVHHYKNDLTAHVLRHGYATLLFEAGVDVYTASKLLGHADVETTIGIYTHLRAKKEATSMKKLKNYTKKIMAD